MADRPIMMQVCVACATRLGRAGAKPDPRHEGAGFLFL